MEALRRVHSLTDRETIAFDFNAKTGEKYRSVIMPVLDDLVDSRDEVRLIRTEDSQSGLPIPDRITVIVGPEKQEEALV